MDHIIRSEESKDSLQLDLQFTASFVHGPFLHERDNWAVVTESDCFLTMWGILQWIRSAVRATSRDKALVKYTEWSFCIQHKEEYIIIYSQCCKSKSHNFPSKWRAYGDLYSWIELRAEADMKPFVLSFQYQLIACFYSVPWLFNPVWQWTMWCT